MIATRNQSFGHALVALKEGKLVSREGWNGKDLHVFRQVPSEVPTHIIHKMTSLPSDAKFLAESRDLPLRYSDQLALLYPDNTVKGWAPSVSDSLAMDWIIYERTVVASDTVGTAKPTE